MLDLITGTLYAIPPSGGGGGDQPFWVQLAPLALIVLVFYFLLIRPQQKKAKQQREMIASLKKGDKVVTAGGIYGTINSISKDGAEIKLEIADKTVIRMKKDFVSIKSN